MLHKKLIVRNYSAAIWLIFSSMKRHFEQLFHAVRNSPFQVSRGILLLILKLLWITFLFAIAICTSSLLLAMRWILKKLIRLLANTELAALKFLHTVCLLADVRLSILRMDQELRTCVSAKVTVTRRDYM